MSDEQWRVIEGYPNYEVSNAGQVRRITNCTSGRTGSILRAGLKGSGYLGVTLCRGGSKKSAYVHRLIATAFLGAPQVERPQVNHINGVKSDNRASNLEYVTGSENMKHSYHNGLHDAKGENNNRSKLTHADVKEIREVMAGQQRPTYSAIAQRFGVSQETIQSAVKGRSWR